MLRIMQQTPVLIFNVNTLAAPFNKELSMVEQVSEICNAQSIGAAILDIVADTLDGGKDMIEKRLKIYGKESEF